ncbi:hypothetical protein FVE85_3816 [Porphyridium purpureum]|uniref:Uncharacterized protein n=1 Tax=Porphyridium purpureum TaxID=35688 RepID=A0A5J4YJM0_PORPP|nr:hypothetical protein FVE85_3816 [Porphyridium purpureum]|eukprot:POR0215..scf243_20
MSAQRREGGQNDSSGRNEAALESVKRNHPFKSLRSVAGPYQWVGVTQGGYGYIDPDSAGARGSRRNRDDSGSAQPFAGPGSSTQKRCSDGISSGTSSGGLFLGGGLRCRRGRGSVPRRIKEKIPLVVTDKCETVITEERKPGKAAFIV